MDPDLLERCIEGAFGLGYRQLAVSGGEPFLYPFLGRLLSTARELGMFTTATTNGLTFGQGRWEAVAEHVDLLAVSIDGRPDEHDLLRGRSGAFDRTVAGLARVRESGVPFCIIFTLTQFNLDSLEFVVRVAQESGAAGVQVHPLTAHGRASTTMTGFVPDEVELGAALLEAGQLGAALGVKVHVDAATVAQLLDHRSHLVPERPIQRTTAVASTLVVNADGVVVPLSHEIDRHFWLGSLHDQGIVELAASWVDSGKANQLASLCESAYAELAAMPREVGCYWYDAVAALSRRRAARTLVRTA
jgi:MoaA/NifB/PqqE/SkfB family radical SAM enzyme